jgi:hypothetical protein
MKTTSYETSKKLAKIGFKAEAHHKFLYSYYDLETILEALPTKIARGEGRAPTSSFIFTKDGMGYAQKPQIEFQEFIEHHENASLADTAARLLILLHEKGLINFNEKEKL